MRIVRSNNVALALCYGKVFHYVFRCMFKIKVAFARLYDPLISDILGFFQLWNPIRCTTIWVIRDPKVNFNFASAATHIPRRLFSSDYFDSSCFLQKRFFWRMSCSVDYRQVFLAMWPTLATFLARCILDRVSSFVYRWKVRRPAFH